MSRLLAACAVGAVAVALGAPPAMAEPSGPTGPPTKTDKRCATLTALVPSVTGVAKGNVSNTAVQARVLRKLAKQKSTPARVERALEKLADWFTAARERSVGERAVSLAVLKPQVQTVIVFATKIGCPPPVTTTTVPAATG